MLRTSIERELGRILDRACPDPDTRSRLAGRHIAIHLLDPKLDLHVIVGELGLTFETRPSDPPDLSLTGTLRDFYRLARGTHPPGLRIEGDLGWIRALEGWAATLPHERSAWIGLLCGPLPATYLNPVLDRLESTARTLAAQLIPPISRLSSRAGLGVDRQAERHLEEELTRLLERLEALESRLPAGQGPE